MDMIKLTGGSEMYQTSCGTLCSAYKSCQIFIFINIQLGNFGRGYPKCMHTTNFMTMCTGQSVNM
jgi:hypothetical protein